MADVLRPIAEQAMRTLVVTAPWPGDTEDELAERVNAAVMDAIPTGRALWLMLANSPEVGAIPGPGAVASTLEAVVRDAVMEAVEPDVWRWVHAVEASSQEVPRG